VTLVGLQWADLGARDIHLLPGLVSPELFRALRAVDQVGTTTTLRQLHNMPDVTVTFAGGLAGAPADTGVTVNPNTGAVTVQSPLPPGRKLRSFIVTATATQPGAAAATIRVRVNVHQAITGLWLTPNPLTVRRGARNVRMSVLASFDDGTIGDITNWSPFAPPTVVGEHVHANGSEDRVLRWSAEGIPEGTDALVGVHPDTGVLDGTADDGSAKITVRFQDRTASAVAICKPPWSTPVRTKLVSGPGVRSLNFVPNILFLPDGFRADEEQMFNRVVRRLVDKLSRAPQTRPFADFSGRINYFSAWVPSREAGVSVLEELDRRNGPKNETHGYPVPLPSLNRPADNWSLADLVNAIGLPDSVDDPAGAPLDDRKVAELRALYGAAIDDPHVRPKYAEWLPLNDRVLLNERDTAFHMAYGSRPSLVGVVDRVIATNSLRLADADFEAFLDALQTPAGLPLVEGPWSRGKDRNLIVVLCRTNRHGGANSSRGSDAAHQGKLLGLSLDAEDFHRLRASDTAGFDLVPDDVGCGCGTHTWLTTAHELAHSWGVGDEYAEFESPVPASVLANVLARANLQVRTELVDGGDQLIDTNIKWGRWPRISAAGVLIQPPTVHADGHVTLRLDPGFGGLGDFVAGTDIVRLRTRPLALSNGTSARFRVVAVRKAASEMDLVPVDPIEADLDNRYPANSIVLRPVRGPDGNDLTLVTPNVRTRITDTHNPLNANPDPPNRVCGNVKLDLPTRAVNFPDNKAPHPPRYSAFTIGLYENGGRYFCGIYRPTGICLMARATHGSTAQHNLQAYEFCLVCRYAMVDAVNPSLHPRIERQYRARYEQRNP